MIYRDDVAPRIGMVLVDNVLFIDLQLYADLGRLLASCKCSEDFFDMIKCSRSEILNLFLEKINNSGELNVLLSDFQIRRSASSLQMVYLFVFMMDHYFGQNSDETTVDKVFDLFFHEYFLEREDELDPTVCSFPSINDFVLPFSSHMDLAMKYLSQLKNEK
jgi:hypothetical protein